MLDDYPMTRIGREVSDARERRRARDEVDVHGEVCSRVEGLPGRRFDVGLDRLDVADLINRIAGRIEPVRDSPLVVPRKRRGESAAIEAAGEGITELESLRGALSGARGSGRGKRDDRHHDPENTSSAHARSLPSSFAPGDPRR